MRRVNAWVFDLDDTLIRNVHDYAYPILDACKLIIDTLGDAAPHVSAITALEQEIDCRRISEVNPATGQVFAYSMDRFPTSLVEVYREICRRAGKLPVYDVESNLLRIGLKAFDPSRYRQNIYPDTLATLNFLQKKGDLILLLTKGDKQVQSRKLSVLDAGKRFYRVRIVESSKTPEVFEKMAEDLSGYQLFSIGNDYEKDIVPALRAGYRGIWIPVETWEVIGRLGEIRSQVDRNRCIELASLGQIVERYDEIVGGLR